ncbi:hypothetical protein [Niveispirillum sp. KHB5.9]|uniref:hypothetical protein n=1 Tax=Niveispirillum sp. KHB5.9 TaxID=3400269 RepID=UPI003A87229F
MTDLDQTRPGASRPPNEGGNRAERFPPSPDDPAGTADRHRIDIDHGAMRDKVAFPDPAAAPLGTDEEAGGSPAAAPIPTLSEPVPGDAEAKTISGEPRSRAHHGWMPIGLLLLGLTALLVTFLD